MRGFVFGFTAATALFLMGPLLAENLVRVEPGKGGSLEARVLLLERAVAQIQHQEDVPAASEGAVNCVLKTPFDGVMAASAATEAEARVAVVAECNRRSKGNLYCEKKGAVCGKK